MSLGEFSGLLPGGQLPVGNEAGGSTTVVRHSSADSSPVLPATPSPAAPNASASPGLGRVRSLDGLRGLAALLVMLHHCLITIPYLEGTAEDPNIVRDPAFVWVYTPLHSLWAGGEMVYVFFVLSGLVLARPYVFGGRLRYVSYLRARLLRLYLPAWGSLLLAAVVIRLLPRVPERGMATALWADSGSPGVVEVLRGATLILEPTHLNYVLWSIRWEVVFSLLLPLYVVVARRIDVRGARLPAWIAAACCASIVGEYLAVGALLYLPMFAIGVLLARRVAQNRSGSSGMRDTAGGRLLLVSGCVGLSAFWWLGVWLPGRSAAAAAGVVVASAAVLVAAAITCRSWAKGLESRFLQWAGRISFSLYLTHLPIVFGLAFLLGPRATPFVPLLAIPICLTTAVAFYRLVEAPAHRLAARSRTWRPVAQGNSR